MFLNKATFKYNAVQLCIHIKIASKVTFLEKNTNLETEFCLMHVSRHTYIYLCEEDEKKGGKTKTPKIIKTSTDNVKFFCGGGQCLRQGRAM